MRSKIANVLDIELTCYEDGIFPPGETQEIIELGITMVDVGSLTIVKTLSIPVIPVMSQVSPYCTALTGWTYAKLERQGVPFAKACRRLAEKYGVRNRLFVTDTDDELETIRAQCRLMGIECPIGLAIQNTSTLFQLMTGQVGKNLSLDEMLAALGMQFEGRRHRASDDSRNIAHLFLKLVGAARLGIKVTR